MTKLEMIRKALRYAILWNDSYIDAIHHCTDDASNEQRRRRLEENQRFQKELDKLTAKG
jgi:hypothetical protein